MKTFSYTDATFEYISCNICGSDDYFVIARKSQNDLDARTCLCKICGLVYINPRMSKQDYDAYYKHYYRQDRTSIKGRTEGGGLEKNFAAARKFGNALADKFSIYLKPGLTVDVGSSTGGILYGLKEKKPELEVLGIEPSLDESNYANAKGIKTIPDLFENVGFSGIENISNVLCVQSLNHLLDPKYFIRLAFERLREGGHIILAVKNFRHQVRRMGKISSGVQIDHPYMFTPETLKLMTEKAGFTVVYVDSDEYKTKEELIKQKESGMSVGHIRLVGRKDKEAKAELIMPKGLPKKIKWQLNALNVKIYYLVRYSRRPDFLRKILHID